MQSTSILAVLVLAFGCTLALDVQHWKLWKEANNKRYSDAEEHIRYGIAFSIYRFRLLIIKKLLFLVELYGIVI
jgi:hypothetical protein